VQVNSSNTTSIKGKGQRQAPRKTKKGDDEEGGKTKGSRLDEDNASLGEKNVPIFQSKSQLGGWNRVCYPGWGKGEEEVEGGRAIEKYREKERIPDKVLGREINEIPEKMPAPAPNG